MYDNDPVQIARIIELSSDMVEYTTDSVKRIGKVRKRTDDVQAYAEKTLPVHGRDHRVISQMQVD